jgi:hypothetical protein
MNAAGLWKRTRQSAQRPSTLTVALVTYCCCGGRAWRCAAPNDWASNRIATTKNATRRFHGGPFRFETICINRSEFTRVPRFNKAASFISRGQDGPDSSHGRVSRLKTVTLGRGAVRMARRRNGSIVHG